LKLLKSKVGILAIIGVALVIFLLAGTSWSNQRFKDISACLICHELFEDFEEYAPFGEKTAEIEDYRPTKELDFGSFDVTVGCGECHMYPYEEYRESAHYENELEVRPGCVGCHEPHSIFQLARWKFLFVNNGSYGKTPFDTISNSLRDVPEWEELRIVLAERVRHKMVDDDSAKCKNCHKPDAEWWKEIGQHKTMKEKGQTCIHCHYNLVHNDVEWPELEAE
jgi:nitrate/TMAO reductase-like tetraheme cytochrome c subunit